MTPPPRLAEPPRARHNTPAPRDCQTARLLRAHWRVHVPASGDLIATTTIAGADLDLVSPDAADRHRGEPAGAGHLVLTFWIDRGTPEKPLHETLAIFAEDPDVTRGTAAVRPQAASIELIGDGDGLHLDVRNGTPLLRFASVRRTEGSDPVIWCQGALHQMLGLGGGQYRLDEVSVDHAMMSRLASPPPMRAAV